jgi:hypothetical protein
MRNRDDELVEHLNGHAKQSAMVRYDIKDHEIRKCYEKEGVGRPGTSC